MRGHGEVISGGVRKMPVEEKQAGTFTA